MNKTDIEELLNDVNASIQECTEVVNSYNALKATGDPATIIRNILKPFKLTTESLYPDEVIQDNMVDDVLKDIRIGNGQALVSSVTKALILLELDTQTNLNIIKDYLSTYPEEGVPSGNIFSLTKGYLGLYADDFVGLINTLSSFKKKLIANITAPLESSVYTIPSPDFSYILGEPFNGSVEYDDTVAIQVDKVDTGYKVAIHKKSVKPNADIRLLDKVESIQLLKALYEYESITTPSTTGILTDLNTKLKADNVPNTAMLSFQNKYNAQVTISAIILSAISNIVKDINTVLVDMSFLVNNLDR